MRCGKIGVLYHDFILLMLTPRKSARSPSTVIASFAFVCKSPTICSISFLSVTASELLLLYRTYTVLLSC